MDKLQIKAQSLPSRCAICHQTDCFDPLRNHCDRCAEIEAEYLSWQALPTGMPFIKAFFLALAESIIGGFTGAFVGLGVGAITSVALEGTLAFEQLLLFIGFIFTSMGMLMGLCILDWNLKTMFQAVKNMLLSATFGAIGGSFTLMLIALINKVYRYEYLFLGAFWGWFLGMFIGRVIKLTHDLYTTGRE